MTEADRWRDLYSRLQALVPPSARWGEDAVQEVAIALWRRSPAADPVVHPTAYLRRCLARALGRLAQRNHDAEEVELVTEPCVDQDPEHRFQVLEDSRRLIAKLKARAPKLTADALKPNGHRQRGQLRKMHKATEPSRGK